MYYLLYVVGKKTRCIIKTYCTSYRAGPSRCGTQCKA